jgi:hypothetical protein
MPNKPQNSPRRASKKTPAKKAVPKEDGFPIRLHVSGSMIDIISPVPREQFIKEMVEAINEHGARPEWSGWYTLKGINGKIVSVRVREIGAAEEL